MSGGSVTNELTILVVCTGNICRSPLAEQLLRAQFAARGIKVTITSAGTGAVEGLPMDETSASLSRELGGKPDGFSSTLLRASLIANADLILTATREQRSDVARLLPRAAPNTFTLNELARKIRDIPLIAAEEYPARADDTARSIAKQLTAMRGLTAPAPQPSADDIEDPFHQPRDFQNQIGLSIDAAVTSIVSAFIAPNAGENVSA